MRLPSPGSKYAGDAIPPLALQTLLRRVSIGLPLAVLVVGFFQIWRIGFRTNFGTAYLVLLVASALLARFMWRRAHDLEAKFVSVRITPDDEPEVKDIMDRLSIAIAGFFIVVALCLPFVSS